MQKLISDIRQKGQRFIYEIIIIGRMSKRIALDFHHFVRSQSQLTRLFGQQNSRSIDSIEIDITYDCNLKCNNCNRSCTQAPSKEEMKVDQIIEFINQSIDNNIKWKKIKLLGGEPTLHSKFFVIIRLLLSYKRTYNPDLRIVVASNGFGEYVKNVLRKIPKEIEVENTLKSSKNSRFFPFNMAPKDSFLYSNVDYSNGCRITSEDGIGLTPYGYYHCAIAGSIDRVFNFGMCRKKLPLHKDSMTDQFLKFCRLCGHFKFSLPTKREKISRSWKKAYDIYNNGNDRFKNDND